MHRSHYKIVTELRMRNILLLSALASFATIVHMYMRIVQATYSRTIQNMPSRLDLSALNAIFKLTSSSETRHPHVSGHCTHSQLLCHFLIKLKHHDYCGNLLVVLALQLLPRYH